VIGDSSRALMLSALADGRAMPAGDLARFARISPQTASSHLDKLFKANLLSVEVQGRHHYYRLRGALIAELIESLSIIARPVEPLTEAQRERAGQLRFARTCYGHLAGKLGVAITEALCARSYLAQEDSGYRISDSGAAWFRSIGIEIGAIKRKPLAKRCLDWSERRHHLAGALGVALCERIMELRWAVRVRDSRALRLSDRGKAQLQSELGLALGCWGVTEQKTHLSTIKGHK
jgi:DNA-binding transcriptional ArsR family regulator